MIECFITFSKKANQFV